MNTDQEVDRLRERVHEMASAQQRFENGLTAHLSVCEKISEHNKDTLARIETTMGDLAKKLDGGLKEVNSAYLKFILMVLGGMGGVLMVIFTIYVGWLITKGAKL